MKNINKYLNYILLTVIIILVIWLSFTRSSLQRSKNDVQILIDSTEYLKNKNGELYATNNSYIMSNKDLKEINAELYKENKKLKDNPLVVEKIITIIEYRDTTLITTIDSTYFKDGFKFYSLNWKKDTTYSKDNYFKIEGNTKLKIDTMLHPISYYSRLNKLELGTKLYLSITDDEKNKQLKINARTDFPGLTFTDIDGYIIDPQKSKELNKYFPKKRWGVSLFGGYGLSLSNPIKLTPIFGIGLSYSIWNF